MARGDPGDVGSPRRLSLNLDPEHLHGVALHRAISSLLTANGPKLALVSPDPYELSRRVEKIDVFLSHDWGTPSWLKVLALVMVFNSRAAAFTSFLVSLVIGVLRGYGALPDEMWTISLSFAAFFIVLGGWQQLRSICLRPLVVFLDFMCIHQKDEELKAKGILGLGGFLFHSEELMILWSPRYFQRLWCAYELGYFLQLRRKARDKICIVPVKVPILVFSMALLWHLLMIAYYLFRQDLKRFVQHKTGATLSRNVLLPVAMPVLAALLLPFMNYVGLTLMRELDQLPRQLRDFQVENSQCFCCTHHHQHPVTGEELLCDRELIYSTLRHRCAHGDALQHFNLEVSGRLGRKCIGSLSSGFPVRYAMPVVAASNLPFFAEVLSEISKGPDEPLLDLVYVVWCLQVVLRWAHPFLSMFFSIYLSELIWRAVQFRSRVLWSIGLSLPIAFVVGCTWICMEFLVVFTDDNSGLPVLPFLFMCAVNMILYLHVLKRGRQFQEQGRSELHPSEASEAASHASPRDATADWERWERESQGDIEVTWRF